MTDIFISYASVDRPAARRLAEALDGCGWSVWWDHRSLRGGQHFERVIEQAILSARVVIVVWSQHSIGSDWVRAEAALALDEKKLVPLRIDTTVLPLRFRNIHTIDLSSWTGKTDAEPFERLLDTLGDFLGRPRPSKETEPPDRCAEPRSQPEPTNVAAGPIPPAVRKHGGKTLIAILATAGVLLGVVVWGGRQPEVQLYLGLMYANAPKVVKYDAPAVRWFRKAAEQGNAEAQFNLGKMYAEDDYPVYTTKSGRDDTATTITSSRVKRTTIGTGRISIDDTEAVRWFRKAAEQEYPFAQFYLDRLLAREQR